MQTFCTGDSLALNREYGNIEGLGFRVSREHATNNR